MQKAIIIFIVLLTSLLANSQTRINGEWWKNANTEMRRGTINGTIDCLTVQRHAKLPKQLTVPEWNRMTDDILAHSKSKTLATALLEVQPKKYGDAAEGGEDYSKEKHGWFDGYYWGSAPDDERYGFLVGYLSCGETLEISQQRVKQYRKEMDEWYDTHPSSNAKIPDVLALIRRTDGNPSRKKK